MAAAKILVVDDDRNLLELARARLESSGYAVVAESEHGSALAAARDGGFDLAIVDLRLADEDGMTVMEKLHAINPEMPVIILTGHASVEGAVEAMKRGAYTYLTKPFDPRELVLQIGRALESHQLATENQRLRGLRLRRHAAAEGFAAGDQRQALGEACGLGNRGADGGMGGLRRVGPLAALLHIGELVAQRRHLPLCEAGRDRRHEGMRHAGAGAMGQHVEHPGVGGAEEEPRYPADPLTDVDGSGNRAHPEPELTAEE